MANIDKGISYFVNVNPLPFAESHSVFTILRNEFGIPIEIFHGDITYPYAVTIDTHWFRPVTIKEHRETFKKSFFDYGTNVKRLDEESIERAWKIFIEDE